MTRTMPPGNQLPACGWIERHLPTPTHCSWCDQPTTRWHQLVLCITCDAIPPRALHHPSRHEEPT